MPQEFEGKKKGQYWFSVPSLQPEYYFLFRKLRRWADLTDKGMIEVAIHYLVEEVHQNPEKLLQLIEMYKTTAPSDTPYPTWEK